LIGLDRIREAARRDKNLRFTSLMHHITIDLLREAYKALKRNAAPGIDEVTWQQYGEKLEENLSKPPPACTKWQIPCKALKTDLVT